MLNFCTYENREGQLIGIKLLALSLEKNCHNFHLTIFLPTELLHFRQWTDKNCKNVTVQVCSAKLKGWDVKAEILMLMLKQFNEAVWLDSDIICMRDLNSIFENLNPQTLLVSQDALPYPKEDERTAFFGWKCVRKLKSSVNTCFIRVTNVPAHINLLKAWSEAMSTNLYQQIQSLPHYKRPDYMIGDQDVLEAVLASCYSESGKEIEIAFLRCGREIITTIVPQAFSIRDRFRASFGRKKPVLVHGQGIQPWDAMHWPPGVLRCASWQMSAYLMVAKPYRRLLHEDVGEWMDKSSKLTRFCQISTLHHPYLQGVPLLLISKFWQIVLRTKLAFRKPITM